MMILFPKAATTSAFGPVDYISCVLGMETVLMVAGIRKCYFHLKINIIILIRTHM